MVPTRVARQCSLQRSRRRLQTTDQAPHVDKTLIAAEADAADEPERGPQRRCIVTREHGDRARMVRFVIGPDRSVVPDLAARLPGRGLWLSARADVVEAARAKGAFARAARGMVIVPPDLGSILQTGLGRRVAEQLGLARRAGQAVAGFAKAREWVEAGRVGLVMQASDGSEDERRRLVSGATVSVAWPMDAAGLGAIFGRDRVVHVAVGSGRLADSLMNEVLRLSGLTGRVMCKQAGE